MLPFSQCTFQSANFKPSESEIGWQKSKKVKCHIMASYQWSTRSRPETALFARSRSRPEICFRNFGSDRDFTDVTLAHVDEREEFSHRNILSSASTKKLAQTKYIEINLSIVLLVQLPLFPQPHLPEEGEVGLQHHQVHHLLAPVPGVRSLQQCNS